METLRRQLSQGIEESVTRRDRPELTGPSAGGLSGERRKNNLGKFFKPLEETRITRQCNHKSNTKAKCH